MNPEQQRVAIAECLGWERGSWESADGVRPRWVKDGRVAYEPNMDGLNRELPDYLNDLNAIHEAERVGGLGLTRCDEYGNLLETIVRRDFQESNPDARVCELYGWHASAKQRAECFLRTLNLWASP